jgi:large subunit ribosomal protein L4
MPKVKVYSAEGKEVGEKNLTADIFSVEVKPNVVHEVMLGLMSIARQPLAHTKVRGEVRGGGRKPWKQKGTGRARQGSIRSPQWKGGAIIFGPRSERDYTVKINAKLKKQALFMALSDKLASGKIVVVEEFSADKGKTKELAVMMAKLPAAGKKTVAVVPLRNEMLSRSARNLKTVNLVTTQSLGLLDLLKADYVVLSSAAVDKIEEKYAKPAKPETKPKAAKKRA